MKRSWRLASLAGININVHWSFSVVLLWVILQGAFEQRPLPNIVVILFGVLLVFACIILHEIGHAFTALSLRVPVKSIMVLPIGGLARIQSVPHKPWHELLIALAGPLVNLALALLLVPLLVLLISPPMLDNLLANPIDMIDSMIIAFFQHNSMLGLIMLLIVANVVLCAFNLIPAFPMDGGRALRAVIGLFLPYGPATRLAVATGFGLTALFLGGAFYLGSSGLFMIGIFTFFAIALAGR